MKDFKYFLDKRLCSIFTDIVTLYLLILYYLLHWSNVNPKDFSTNFRNYVNGQIRQSRSYYYENKFIAVKNDTEQTWRIIRGIIKKIKPNGRKHHNKDN